MRAEGLGTYCLLTLIRKVACAVENAAKKLESNVTDCALVFEGGGYRAGYTAAMANVLLANGIYFDYVCGVSAGASNTVDYLSRDQKRTRDAFASTDWVSGHVGLPSIAHGTGYFDADAIYEGAVVNGTFPFDWKTFRANPAGFGLQAFDRDTGRTVRFGRDDATDLMGLIDFVRASSTLPGMMRPKPIDGHVLYDGGLGQGAGIGVCMAEAAGYEKFVFLATREKGYRKTEPAPAEVAVIKRAAADYPYLRQALLTRWERYNAELDRVEGLAAEGRCLIIYPDHMPVSSTTVSPAKLEASYQMGWQQAVRDLPRVREFVFGDRDAGPHGPNGWDGYITIG